MFDTALKIGVFTIIALLGWKVYSGGAPLPVSLPSLPAKAAESVTSAIVNKDTVPVNPIKEQVIIMVTAEPPPPQPTFEVVVYPTNVPNPTPVPTNVLEDPYKPGPEFSWLTVGGPSENTCIVLTWPDGRTQMNCSDPGVLLDPQTAQYTAWMMSTGQLNDTGGVPKG